MPCGEFREFRLKLWFLLTCSLSLLEILKCPCSSSCQPCPPFKCVIPRLILGNSRVCPHGGWHRVAPRFHFIFLSSGRNAGLGCIWGIIRIIIFVIHIICVSSHPYSAPSSNGHQPFSRLDQRFFCQQDDSQTGPLQWRRSGGRKAGNYAAHFCGTPIFMKHIPNPFQLYNLLNEDFWVVFLGGKKWSLGGTRMEWSRRGFSDRAWLFFFSGRWRHVLLLGIWQYDGWHDLFVQPPQDENPESIQPQTQVNRN